MLPVQLQDLDSFKPLVPLVSKHCKPPQAGGRLLQVLVWVPVAPQPTVEHVLHADHPPFTGVFPVHAWSGIAGQLHPAQVTLVQIRVPATPHAVAEQADQALHVGVPGGAGV